MTRWGILGLGRIAHKFAQDLLTLPDAELYAVAATDAQRAAQFAAQYGVPHAFGRYDGLLTLPDLDVVYIATPHVQHAANTLLCLRGKKAVLCEKPFGMHADEVGQMIETARSENVFLMEALWTRFMPGMQRALDLIRAGTIGRVQLIKADFGFAAPFNPDGRLFNKTLGGGSLLDIGIYPLFLSYLVLGMPAQIQATATFGQTGVDEQCGMLLTYPDGAMALLDSTLRAKTRTEAIIYGDAGTIHLPGRFHEPKTLVLERPDRAPETMRFERPTIGYAYEARHVMDCLRDGRTESPVWSLTDSQRLMDLLDAVRRQAGIRYDAVAGS